MTMHILFLIYIQILYARKYFSSHAIQSLKMNKPNGTKLTVSLKTKAVVRSCNFLMELICSFFFLQEKRIMIVGHGANSMTMEEARAKLCAEAKYVFSA